MSMPLPFQSARLGTVNNYATRPHALTEEDVEVATAVAPSVAYAVGKRCCGRGRTGGDGEHVGRSGYPSRYRAGQGHLDRAALPHPGSGVHTAHEGLPANGSKASRCRARPWPYREAARSPPKLMNHLAALDQWVAGNRRRWRPAQQQPSAESAVESTAATRRPQEERRPTSRRSGRGSGIYDGGVRGGEGEAGDFSHQVALLGSPHDEDGLAAADRRGRSASSRLPVILDCDDTRTESVAPPASRSSS